MTLTVAEAMQIEHVSLGRIRSNPWQPRTIVDQAKYEETRESVRQNGLFQFPSGRRCPDGVVQLADGHLRHRIFQDLQREEGEKWNLLPVIVRDLTDQQMADAIVESNEKRQGLNPIDLARFLRRYLDDFGITQEAVGVKFSMSQPAIANTLRLLTLPEKVQGMIISQQITATHGRELLKAQQDPAMQERLAEETARQSMSVERLAAVVSTEIRREGRPLYKTGWPEPAFDLKMCDACLSRSMIEDYNDKEKPYCMKSSCWERKQKAAQDKQAEALRQKVQAEASGKKILDLQKLSADKYIEISGKDTFTSECQGCENQAIGKGWSGLIQTVCINPACYRKKKNKVARDEKSRKEDIYQAQLVRLKELLDLGQPFDARTCILILEAFRGYEEEKLIAREMGLATKGWGWRGAALEAKLREQPVERLRWFVVLVATQRRFSPLDWGGDRAAQFEAFLTGQDFRRQEPLEEMRQQDADDEGSEDE